MDEATNNQWFRHTQFNLGALLLLFVPISLLMWALTPAPPSQVEFSSGPWPDSPIGVAAAEGDSASLQRVIADDPTVLNKPDERGWTPLHWAVSMNQLTVARLLLDNGADVNAQTLNYPKGKTPLTMSHTSEMTDLLLSRQSRSQ